MTIVLGVSVLVLSLLGWGGQVISAIAPQAAARWGLTESETEVDPVFHADSRAECIWDSLSLWTLPLAAVLLLLDEHIWTIPGFIGGGMYVYFAGRGIAARLIMLRRGIKIGEPATVKTAFVFLTLWGAAGAATSIVAGLHLLEG